LYQPGEADHSVELTGGRVLALVGRRLTSQDTALLEVFLAQLSTRRERAVLDSIPAKERPS